MAKGIRPQDAPHICYCHTPMRYIWNAGEDYRPGIVRRTGLSVARPWLRRWDRSSSRRVDHFIANSAFVADQIETCYGRSATVVHPPVDTEFFAPPRQTEDFYLSAGALVAYKRVDLTVEAFNRNGRRLVVVGDGPERRRLMRQARPNIEFKGWISTESLRNLYRQARALIFPGREDFGIVPIEARCCGCPVIALNQGGAAKRSKTVSMPCSSQLPPSPNLLDAIDRFERFRMDRAQVRNGTHRFSRERFKSESKTSYIPADRGGPVRLLHPSVHGIRGYVRRTLDAVAAFVLLIFLSPLMAVVALAIRLLDGGPAFYRQRESRVRRPSIHDTEISHDASEAEAKTGPMWSTSNDSRCTRFGARLRRTGLDELPQLWNVIRGEMSLVGPRPERLEFAREFKKQFADYDQRHTVRGGLTGYAQIHGWRGDTDIGERVHHDLHYIRRWSLALDLYILGLTLVRGGSDRTRDGVGR